MPMVFLVFALHVLHTARAMRVHTASGAPVLTIDTVTQIYTYICDEFMHHIRVFIYIYVVRVWA